MSASWEIRCGDCIALMRGMPEASVDAVVTDPPYNLSFMGATWDSHGVIEDAGLGYYIAGLIDGEGHFAIKRHTRGTHAPAFTLKLRADEEDGLRRIVRSLGFGSISRERRHEAHDMVKWSVQSREDCQRLVDLLDKYGLRLKKRHDYVLWREAVCEWTGRARGNRWHGPAGNERMAALRTRLMEGRRYIEPAWSGNEFQDWCRLWGSEVLRVLKPGGHAVVFGGTRTFHRLTCGLEDAGFEIRDCLMWLYGSGFAKSWNMSRFDGEWCSRNPLPYSHASDADMRGLRERVQATAEPRSTGEGDNLLAEVQRRESRQGLGDTRTQGPSRMVDGDEGVVSPVDHRQRQPELEGWQLSGRQGLPAREDAESPEGSAERLRAGACLGSRADVGTTVAPGRGGSSSQSKTNGQPSGESEGLQQPSGALDVGAPGVGGRCPRCGGLRREFEGFGTALKPAWEPIVLARKPLAGTVAANVAEYGTGAINVDGCRIAASDDDRAAAERHMSGSNSWQRGKRQRGAATFDVGEGDAAMDTRGRWPANVILDESAALLVDEQSGDTASSVNRVLRRGVSTGRGMGYGSSSPSQAADIGYSDQGGASRFMYCAKTSKEERNRGLEGRNDHPTVKPVELMRWLVRLITPPEGIVLDPFAGSGTTGIASLREGFSFVGLERDEHYCDIARARIVGDAPLLNGPLEDVAA